MAKGQEVPIIGSSTVQIGVNDNGGMDCVW